MKLRDLMDIADVERRPPDVLANIPRGLKVMEHLGTSADNDALLGLMYGNEADELELEQQREDLRKIRAQADKLAAEAARTRSEVDARRASRG